MIEHKEYVERLENVLERYENEMFYIWQNDLDRKVTRDIWIGNITDLMVEVVESTIVTRKPGLAIPVTDIKFASHELEGRYRAKEEILKTLKGET